MPRLDRLMKPTFFRLSKAPVRWLFLFLLCLIAGCGDGAWTTSGTGGKAAADARLASTTTTGLGTSPARVVSYDSELATLSAAISGAMQSIAARPDDSLLALETVALLVERARLSGNYDDYRRAEQLLAETTTRLGRLSYPCLAQAQLHYTLHRLAAAAAALDACPVSVAQDMVLGLRGDIAFYSGRYQEAERIYRDLVNQTGTPQHYIRLALVRNRLGSPGEAAAFLEAADKRYHGVSATMKAWLKLQRGLLAFERGRLDEAIALYRLASDELPGWWLIDEHIAEALRLGPDPGPVQAAYEDLVRRTAMPEMMDELARVLLGGDNPQAATPWIERAAAIYRDRMLLFPEASAGHAVDHFLQFGSAQDALALARRSVEMRPYGEALIALATAQLRAGQAAQAETTIAQVQASGWNTADLHVVAAQVHAGLGNGADAAAARARALAMNPHAVRLYAIAMPAIPAKQEPAPRR